MIMVTMTLGFQIAKQLRQYNFEKSFNALQIFPLYGIILFITMNSESYYCTHQEAAAAAITVVVPQLDHLLDLFYLAWCSVVLKELGNLHDIKQHHVVMILEVFTETSV